MSRSTSITLAPQVARLQQALVRRDAVALAARGVVWGGLGLGVAALLARVGLEATWRQAALAFLPLLLVPLGAWVVARRRSLGAPQAAAWLDAETGGAGAIVTASEVTDSRWRERVDAQLAAAPAPPGPDFKAAGRQLGLALGFGIAVLVVPVRRVSAGAGTPKGLFEPAIERVQEKLAALDEVLTFAPEEADELAQALERLRDEARASTDPEATFESIARLQERLEDAADEALDAAERADEALAEAAARAAQDAAPEGALAAALEALSASSIDLEALAAKLPEGLDLSELGLELGAGSMALPDGVQLDPELAAALSKELQQLLREQLQALADAGLLDGNALEGLGEHALLDPSQLAALTPEELAALEPCPLCKDLPPGAT